MTIIHHSWFVNHKPCYITHRKILSGFISMCTRFFWWMKLSPFATSSAIFFTCHISSCLFDWFRDSISSSRFPPLQYSIWIKTKKEINYVLFCRRRESPDYLRVLVRGFVNWKCQNYLDLLLSNLNNIEWDFDEIFPKLKERIFLCLIEPFCDLFVLIFFLLIFWRHKKSLQSAWQPYIHDQTSPNRSNFF